jgi:hypothetical protein
VGNPPRTDPDVEIFIARHWPDVDRIALLCRTTPARIRAIVRQMNADERIEAHYCTVHDPGSVECHRTHSCRCHSCRIAVSARALDLEAKGAL